MAYMRCINNQGYEASLTKDAVYKVLSHDDQASLRVIDNEGEDYLYDANRFESVEIGTIHHEPTETVTVHIDPLLKSILRAEALATRQSVSALLRAWIDERLDLPATPIASR